ncbi:type II toxin-antitoxin system RelE/ParE family toxin [Maribellus sediminis]|uniref:type II toxin-antitoxin system RelE/ParE family toxin n=1 Tax=Maribellus sediminis TaxID=2696285 RepID=UPI001430D688|nr:type II toxin-antitoxin system RelE/ParE family toxin [Maribellus sediminis]
MQKISSKNFKVLVTSNFKKEAKSLVKKYPSFKSDLLQLIQLLEQNPQTGTALGKDCYKIRMAITSKGKGKSCGSRVITCVKIVASSVFLLSVFDKSAKEGLTDKELDVLLEIAGLNI